MVNAVGGSLFAPEAIQYFDEMMKRKHHSTDFEAETRYLPTILSMYFLSISIEKLTSMTDKAIVSAKSMHLLASESCKRSDHAVSEIWLISDVWRAQARPCSSLREPLPFDSQLA